MKKHTLQDCMINPDPLTEFENELMNNQEVPKNTSLEPILNEFLTEKNMNKINIFSCQNATLSFIKPNGEAASTTEKKNLSIYKVQGENSETIFLEVDTWVYPLFPGYSPVYRNGECEFIFPDIYSEVDGATVIIVLPKEESDAVHEVLTQILSPEDGLSRPRRGTILTVSDNILSGSNYLSKKLVEGSTNLTYYMDLAGSGLVEKMNPTSSVSINPKVLEASNVAAQVSGTMANVSDSLSSKLRNAITNFSRYIPHYVKSAVRDRVPEIGIHAMVNIGEGLLNVYDGLEESAGVLASSLSKNTVKVLEHRYGQPAGAVAGNVLSTVGNIYNTRRNVSLFKPKSIAKATLRSAGQAIMEDRREMRREDGDSH